MKKERQDRADFELILIAYSFRGYDKGAQGIYMRLLHMNPPVIMNVKKIRRLMKKNMALYVTYERQILIEGWRKQ